MSHITLRIDDELLARVDEARGREARGAFVKRALLVQLAQDASMREFREDQATVMPFDSDSPVDQRIAAAATKITGRRPLEPTQLRQRYGNSHLPTCKCGICKPPR